MRRGRFFRKLGFVFSFSLVLFALVQCWSSEQVSTPSILEKTRTTQKYQEVSPTITPTIRKSPTATTVFIQMTDLEISSSLQDQSIAISLTAASDPLRFVFPESPPAPVSAWRPPLYPVPWAPTPHDHFYFSRPIAADEVNWPLANYRYGGVFFEGQVHTGVDFPARKGTPVIAAGAGKVIWAGWGLYRGVVGDITDPYGQAVVIRHDFGYQGMRLYTVYGHLDRIDISLGNHVLLGDQIGLVGDTGFVTGPHLHFEVRVGESDFFKTYNPELWLVPPQGWGVAVARILNTTGYSFVKETLRIKSRLSEQVWKAVPYGGGAVNSDPYYQENMVISDLPAGLYDVTISYAGRFYSQTIEIYPGRVTYFRFQGRNGFSLQSPAEQNVEFNPLEENPHSP